MADPRVDHLARLLVEYSTSVRPGDRAFIIAEPVAAPLVMALYEKTFEAGAFPELLLKLPGDDEALLRCCREEQLDTLPALEMMAYETFDVRIRIYSESNTKDQTHSDKERMARRRRARQPILKAQLERGERRELRWLSTLYPTEAYAQDAEMSLRDYESFFYRACHVDDPTTDAVKYWQGVKKELDEVVAFLAGKETVELRGPHCDLRLSIQGRKFEGCHGDSNMPDGEIFTGPVEQSVEGWVRFTYPAIWLGNKVEGIELRFSEGRVVQAKASHNQEFLDSMLKVDSGSCYIGEFGIGMNYGVDRFTGHILFDEKIGGTFHLALGAGYPETGSKNVSGVHWDMICDMRQGTEMLVDGELVYKEGKFQL